MRWLVLAALLVIGLVGPPAEAQIPQTGWSPVCAGAVCNAIIATVSSTSSNVALPNPGSTPPPPNARVCNTGAIAMFVNFGGSSVVATTSSAIVYAGACANFSPPPNATFIAAITASSTTSLEVEVGSGNSISGRRTPGWVFAFNPAVDFRFSEGLYWQGAITDVGSALTVSRASTRYCDDLAGNWISVGNNLPCITNKGLSVWESRTNSIRNSTMQGAVAGTPGTLPTHWALTNNVGLSTSVIGTGTQNGLSYIDIRFFGTASGSGVIGAGFEVADSSGIPASTGQSWAESCFYALAGGSLTNTNTLNLGIDENTAAGAFVRQDVTVQAALTSSLQRGSNNVTLSGGGTVGAITGWLRLNVTGAAAVDVTLRIGWPQLEGTNIAFAGPPIPTTSAAVTAAADAVTLTNVPAWGGAYTLFAKGASAAPIGNNFNVLLQVDQGSNSNRSLVYRNTGNGKGSALVTGGGLNSTAGSVIAANATTTLALAAAPSDQAYAQAGSIIASSAAGTPPVPTVVRIGSDSGTAAQWNGYIQRVALWPTTRLPNSVLQTITSAGVVANDNGERYAANDDEMILPHDIPKRKIW